MPELWTAFAKWVGTEIAWHILNFWDLISLLWIWAGIFYGLWEGSGFLSWAGRELLSEKGNSGDVCSLHLLSFAVNPLKMDCFLKGLGSLLPVAGSTLLVCSDTTAKALVSCICSTWCCMGFAIWSISFDGLLIVWASESPSSYYFCLEHG